MFDPGGGEPAIITLESRNEHIKEEDGIFQDVEVSVGYHQAFLDQTNPSNTRCDCKINSQDPKLTLHLVPVFSTSTMLMFGDDLLPLKESSHGRLNSTPESASYL